MEKEISVKIYELFNTLDNISWDISQAKTDLDVLESKIKENNEKVIKDIDNLKRELKRDLIKISNKVKGRFRYLEDTIKLY